MNIYLKDIPLAQAQALFHKAIEEAGLWNILGVEEIPLDENALGRILAEPVWAKQSNPNYHAAGMDGFAIQAGDSAGASPSMPVVIKVGTQAGYVDTGDPLPGWANAVVPIENVESIDIDGQIARQPRTPHSIRLRAGVTPWSNVRPLGEDIIATELVIPAGAKLRPVDLAGLAAAGFASIRVTRKPRVAVLPTGNELVPPGRPVQPGEITEFNSILLVAQVNEWGSFARRFPIIRDEKEAIYKAVLEAARNCDLVLLNAGSSAGAEDFSADVVKLLGSVLVHGVAVRPGHPVILGMLNVDNDRKVPIIGVPGYPVSAALTGEIFIEPLLARWQGRQALMRPKLDATLTRKVNSPPGDDDFLRVSIGVVGEKVLAAPLPQGAGMITSLMNADGYAVIPRGTQGLEAGTAIRVNLYRQWEEIENTIFTIGSHDLTLDLLAQYLSKFNRRLASVNAGSLGGLLALKREEAHFAGSHLFDPETGEYNIAYIHRYLAGVPVSVFGWVGRKQGLIVSKGNPKNIQSLQDLSRKDVVFVNRQRGAGTRVLLDYHLSLMGIPPETIQGYAQEEYTHMAIAAAVKSGRADCGLGVAAAAAALELDFVPMFDEQYELVFPKAYVDSDLLKPVFELANDDQFRQAAMSLAGYDVQRMGVHIIDIK